MKKAKNSTAQKPNGFVLGIVYGCLKFYYFICGVHMKAVNRVRKPEGPSSVLCSHGSFIDFVFAAKQYAENYGLLEIAGSDNHSAGDAKALAGIYTDTPIADEQDFIRRVLNKETKIFSQKLK